MKKRPFKIQDWVPGVKGKDQPRWQPLEYAKFVAFWDGKPKRKPKKGEWFISGAIPEAYQAPNDLNTKYYIAELKRVERKTVFNYFSM
jgi:hypothetical protein